MNILLHELRTYRSSTIIWTASLCGLVLMFMAMFPAFTRDIDATRNMLAQLPEALRAAFSIQLETFFTVFGFYAYLMSFAMVAGAVQAMNLGTGVISKEVAGKTADFLLSKPVTRQRVVTAKMVAALISVVFTSAVFSAVSYVAATAASEEPVAALDFLLMSSTFFLVQLFFVALGGLFAVIIPKVKSVISVTLPTVFAFYIVGTLGEVLGNVDVRYLSPFKFHDMMYIASKGAFETKFVILESVLVVAAVVATYVIYLKRDVRAAA